jgi:glutaredoxin
LGENLNIVVYTLEICPNCEILKNFIKANGFEYSELDLSDPVNMTELRLNNVFVREAPVLQVGDTFLTSSEIFKDGSVNADAVLPLIKGD